MFIHATDHKLKNPWPCAHVQLQGAGACELANRREFERVSLRMRSRLRIAIVGIRRLNLLHFAFVCDSYIAFTCDAAMRESER